MTRSLPKSILENLRFLSVEIDSQLTTLQDYFTTPSAVLARRILDRGGYAYNLKLRIHEGCVTKLTACEKGCSEKRILRGIEFIATGLERIAQLARDCVKQTQKLENHETVRLEPHSSMLARVRKGVALIESAISDNDTQVALKIGQAESKLDRDYKKLLKAYVDDLKTPKNREDLIIALFVAHSVEQMGDVLLEISEAIISANLGQVVNFERYYSLINSVEQLEDDEEFAGMQIEPIAETKSGSAISAVSAPSGGEDDYVGIFKEGEKSKLKEEREGLKNWHEIYPGLAPKILSYKKRGQSAALLIEHLPGSTFEQIVINEQSELLHETLHQLLSTLRSIWTETRTSDPVSAKFMRQLQSRLSDIYKIHPEFNQGGSQLCGVESSSFDDLVNRAEAFEADLVAPFSVYIHGDFNVDNIMYDPLERRINFIDLHRSRYMDYVQDVSVFMVSNYRLQILDKPLRHRIMQSTHAFYSEIEKFASKVDDKTFQLRLALGLARSFATSTRFILDKSLSRSMFLRARYLLEMVLSKEKSDRSDFTLPVKEIFVG